LLAFWRQLLKLGMHLPCRLLLLGSQVLPGFHTVQNPLLLLGRAPAEVLQSLLQLLLPLRGQSPKLRIVL
jgi:hypothetical protein